ncbi:MAG: hypothetical protein M3P33_00985 [bacterium]|nr:hypothetical protein [bacterium]
MAESKENEIKSTSSSSGDPSYTDALAGFEKNRLGELGKPYEHLQPTFDKMQREIKETPPVDPKKNNK